MTDHVDALIAEARSASGGRFYGPISDDPKVLDLIDGLADALEAATVAPAVDREALVEVLARADALSDEQWSSREFIYGPQADAIIASGILRDVRDVQAEALEEAAKAMRSDRDDFYVDVALGGADFVAEWVDARAQAIRGARNER